MAKRYRGNHGEDIAKLFHMESREKKRIGSNIHSRASTRKGGGNKPLKTPYYFMTNKEKKNLNGEVKTLNLNELMPIEQFNRLSKDVQKDIMVHWRNKYKVKEIVSALGVNDNTYYSILDELGIERTLLRWHEASPERIEEMMNTIVSYQELMDIPPVQRWDVLAVYFDKYDSATLSNTWDVSKQRVYTLKNQMKSYFDGLNKSKPITKEVKPVPEKAVAVQPKPVVVQEQPVTVQEQPQVVSAPTMAVVTKMVDEQESSSFYFNINQKGDNNSLIKKLNMLIGILEDGEEYELELTVKQK